MGQPVILAEGRYQKTVGTLVTLNLLCLTFMGLGFYLDKKKLYQFDSRADLK